MVSKNLIIPKNNNIKENNLDAKPIKSYLFLFHL